MSKKKTIIALLISAAAVALTALCLLLPKSGKSNFTVNDTLPDGENKKATVIILAGQSNASGSTSDEYLRRNVSAEKYAEYENGYENVYINYYASGPNKSDGFVKCTTRQGKIGGFFGPELGMAERLTELYPDETFFIIKFAKGGTNLYKQWLSPSSKGKTGELYRQFVDYVSASIAYLESKGYDVEIEAMCWMQGEADSINVENATSYGEHLSNFINDVRKKFKRYSSDDEITFIDAFISANSECWKYHELVNDCKKAVADSSPLNVVIDTNKEGLTCKNEPEEEPDIAHYDSTSEIKLGHLFAEEVAKLLK